VTVGFVTNAFPGIPDVFHSRDSETKRFIVMMNLRICFNVVHGVKNKGLPCFVDGLFELLLPG
jgi:hypothetical protein